MDAKDSIEETGAVHVSTLKSLVLGGDDSTSNIIQGEDEDARRFGITGALEPPYNPRILVQLFEHSNSLRQNVDAYATNIDGFGHRFEPVIDLDKPEANQRIAQAIYQENLRDRGRFGVSPEVVSKPLHPTDAEVDQRKAILVEEMRSERARLERFFESCSVDISFVTLRRQTRQDLEITGNAYWEVIRNGVGEIAEFNYVESFSVRLMAMDTEPTEINSKVKVSDVLYDTRKRLKKFRRMVQVFENRTVYFKEFGDPRTVSSATGKVYSNGEDLRRHEPNARPATELIHFKIHSCRSAYGVPRWIGTLIAVLGSRQSEEVNFLYFENKSVPPLALIVSGGSIGDSAVQRIESFVNTELKGKRNFHKILLIEGEPAAGSIDSSSRMKISLQPLTQAQQKDGLFQEYDQNNQDKVGMSFRLPRLLRGDIRDFNRACYSADTETLTEHGWKLHGEIGEDEKVAAYDPKTGKVAFVVPARKLVYDVTNEEMWHYHNQHTDCLITHDHTMLVRSAQTRAEDPPWEVFKADGIPYNRFEVTLAATCWDGQTLSCFALPKTSMCSIERGHQHEVPISGDDWLEFLGYWIAEGGLVATDHPAAPYLVYIDQKKPDVASKIRACLDRIGWDYSTQEKPCGTTHFLFSNRCLRDWLITNCGTHAHDKRIPWEYLNLCTRQLRILYEALLAGDGSDDPRENRNCEAYYSTSTVLVGQVQRLLVQVGQRASVAMTYEAEGNRAAMWRVCTTTKKTTRLTPVGQHRTPPSLEKVRYTGEVYCFSVPGYGFFVTRRNGKVAIQGNTADAAVDLAERQVFAPERDEFDFAINHKIFSDLGIRFWKFRSNASAIQDPETLTKIITGLVNANVLVPEEARELAELVFNKELPRLNADWTKQPIQVTLAGIANSPDPLEPWTGESDGIGENFADFGDTNADGSQTPADELTKPAVTPTMAGYAFSTDEVRAMHGHPPLGGQDGQLPMAVYAEQMRQRYGIALPGARVAGPPALKSESFVAEVRRMIALRKVLVDLEARQAAKEFYAAKKAELGEPVVTVKSKPQ